ncbi:MAG: hypothetical protein ACOWWR_11000 [Eubacteriales bacterium]
MNEKEKNAIVNLLERKRDLVASNKKADLETVDERQSILFSFDRVHNQGDFAISTFNDLIREIENDEYESFIQLYDYVDHMEKSHWRVMKKYEKKQDSIEGNEVIISYYRWAETFKLIGESLREWSRVNVAICC